MSENKFKGLTPQEVEESRQQHGENVITPPKKESVLQLFLEKFNDPIIKVLLVAALLSLGIAFIDGDFLETIGIFSAIFLATGVAFWFEYDAKRKFDLLNQVNDDTPIKVIREGHIMEIPKREVVVGDIIVLQSGEEIPADGELLEATSMKVNESTLTGEPVIEKTIDPEHFENEATYPSNMVMRGTTVIEGHGIMRADKIGDLTEFGKVAEQSTTVTEEKTPLNKQLEKLSGLIGKFGTALSVLIFIVLVVKGYFVTGELASGDMFTTMKVLLDYFMVAVVLMVMAIPEGLPMSITLSLAMSMRRMLKTNNLVRKMHACETMGAVTVICTDKTGTLTQNQMRIHEIKRYGNHNDQELYQLISSNSTAFLDGENKVIGNPTEGALLLWMNELGVDYSLLRSGAEQLDQMTFTTERKFMATLIKAANDDKFIYVKGAPEVVKRMCSSIETEDDVELKLSEYQNKAMRTLGFALASTTLDSCEEILAQQKLEFVAIAAISDPVRKDVPAAIGACVNAGVRVKIVTGDTPATAREIARQIGLWNDNEDSAINEITGVEFEALSDEELLDRVADLKIMSRARPLDKQRLVQLLQRKGEVVAVTGDGTNDAPALNFAQVGLSMGTGTSVAKEASDITLLDDSFASIVTAIMWGRSLYQNIQKFIVFQLTINFAALIVVFIGAVFGNGAPLTVTQILWVNIIMDTFAAMALASLPPNKLVLNDKPRGVNDFIITKKMIQNIIGIGSLFVVILLSILFGGAVLFGGSVNAELDTHFHSIFFTTFVMLQFWNLFNAKVFNSKVSAWKNLSGSKGFMMILLLILVGQILIVSFGGEMFSVSPLTLNEWLMIIGGTSLIMIGGEVARLFRRQ